MRRVEDNETDELDRWLERLETSRLVLPLPADAGMNPTMTWLYAGSSDVTTNRSFLAEELGGTVDEDFIDWLSAPGDAPAYWSMADDFGVRVPFEIGARTFSTGHGMPEDLAELDLLIKIAVVGDRVVAVLGVGAQRDYELPASLVASWAPDLDPWAISGPSGFAYKLFESLLGDIAWHNTAIQTFTGEIWHTEQARARLQSTIIMEAHLAELRIQHDSASQEGWFTAVDPRTLVAHADKTLNICVERLKHARELERDQLQLELLKATVDLSLAEQEERKARKRAAEATEGLTRRITVLSTLFLPATLMVGLLGANWSEEPLPGHWLGLLIVIGLVLSSTATGGLLFLRRASGAPSSG
jgi:hypothetical protein